MKLSIQEKQIVKVLEHFGFSDIEKSFGGGFSFAQPEHLLIAERHRRLFVKVEAWNGKFTVATVGSHWSIEDAIKMQGQLDFAITVLTALIEVAPEKVEMEHPVA